MGPSSAFVTTNSLTTTQGISVKLDTSNPGQFLPCSAATDLAIGQLMDQPGAGQTGSIRVGNASAKSYVQLGATVSAIATPLVSNSKGQAIPATQTAAGSQPTQNLLGWSTETGTAGAIIEIYPAGIGEKY